MGVVAEGCESPDGTVKRIHNGNTTLAVFSVPALPLADAARMESVALRGPHGWERIKRFLIKPLLSVLFIGAQPCVKWFPIHLVQISCKVSNVLSCQKYEVFYSFT